MKKKCFYSSIPCMTKHWMKKYIIIKFLCKSTVKRILRYCYKKKVDSCSWYGLRGSPVHIKLLNIKI